MALRRRITTVHTGDRQVDDIPRQVNACLDEVDSVITNINTTIDTGARVGVGAYTSRPAGNASGDTYYPTDAFGPWVYDGTLWRPIVPALGVPGYAPPAASNFTAQNGGTSTLTDTNGRLGAYVQSQSAAGTTTIRGWSQSLVGGASAYVEGSWVNWTLQNTGSRTGGFGVGMRESATGKVAGCYFYRDNASGVKCVVGNWAAMTSSISTSITYDVARDDAYFIRIRRNGANIEMAVSKDRSVWGTTWVSATTAVFTTAPDQALVFAENYRPDIYDLTGYLVHYVNG